MVLSDLGVSHVSTLGLLVFRHQLQQLASMLIDQVQALVRLRVLCRGLWASVHKGA